jgi:gliding motility-associated-like protein
MASVCDNGLPNPICSSLSIEVLTNFQPYLSKEGEILENIDISIEQGEARILSSYLIEDKNTSDFHTAETEFISGSGSLRVEIDNDTKEASIDFIIENFEEFERGEFRIKICDNNTPQLCSEIPVTITREKANTAPILLDNNVEADSIFFEILEGNELNECLSLFDADGDSISILSQIIVQGEGDIDFQDNSCFTYKPTELYFGLTNAEVVIQDNGTPQLSNTFNIYVNVLPLNDPPLAVNDTFNVTSQEIYTFDLIENDTDPENEGIFISEIIESPEGVELRIVSENEISFGVDDNKDGEDIFTYRICDNGVPEACSEAQVIIRYEFEDEIGDIVAYQAFSPNGDGVNDLWIIENITDYPDNSVRIFDQWNNLIFSMDNYDNQNNVWSGEKNGALMSGDAADGIYFYAIDKGNDEAIVSGFVVLKR